MKSRILLLVGLVLILFVGSLSFFYVKSNADRITRNSMTATARVVSIAKVNATATAAITTLQNPYPPYAGTLLLNATLNNNTKNPVWDEGTVPNYGSCTFTDGAYHAEVQQTGQFYYCSAEAITVGNFAYQVQMTIIKGDFGGISFRSGANGSLYYFYIDMKGDYELDVNKDHNFIKAISSGFSSAIKTGFGQPNLLAVVAQGNSFDLYVNLHHIAHGTDATFNNGQIGILVLEQHHQTQVVYHNAKVWKL